MSPIGTTRTSRYVRYVAAFVGEMDTGVRASSVPIFANRVVNFAQTDQAKRNRLPDSPHNLGVEMDKRAAEIERFVRQHNIEHYRKLLGEPTDPLRRQQLQMLLAELEPTQQ